MRLMFLPPLCLIALAGCRSERERPAPEKITSAPDFPDQASSLTVPITLRLDEIQRGLESDTPRRLWSIDEQRSECVPAQRVKVFGRKLKVTPKLGCRIVGHVNRGRISLSGSGQRLVLRLPISATISARDVGGVLKGETATAAAIVRADVRLALDPQWNARARVQISYDWTEPPGIDFLGQRIKFAKRADRELAGVIAGLERDVQRQIDRARVRPVVADAWKHGFAVISLNRDNPPAWLRVTPTALDLADFTVAGRTARLTVTAQAKTETFVGDKPDAPQPTPLPRQSAARANRGVHVFLPVLADYAQLEPVVLRALQHLAQRGIAIENVGHVEADFRKVTIYATHDNRLAVGVDAYVEPVSDRLGARFGKARGRVWLTGEPVNAANSQVVRVENLDIYGGADRAASDLLIQLLSAPTVRAAIAAGLTQNFERDYARVLTAARTAIASRQEGDFRLTASIDSVQHGPIRVTGAGLFLPVVVTGKGAIVFAPRR